MKTYTFRRIQRLPIGLEPAWEFFSDPRNLARITPPGLGFTITSELPGRVYPGLIIAYRIRPLLGLPVSWVTEITHLREPHFFVDEQRAGPYRFWHHQHVLRDTGLGVEVTDIVHYALPFGLLGRLANVLVVARRLKEIFDYRERVLQRLFAMPAPAAAPHSERKP
ncbi:MAG: hypothetical protein C4524_10770 [Candidatus Zixiibacteriota bacterium]|nr:MAG: hypothetical protein C4524_10770 [candidate division Zixibacteria bacterium]